MSEALQLFLAAMCGLIAIEGYHVSRGIMKDHSPSTFSWGYYFRQPRNITLLVMNAAGTVGLLIAHKEVVMIVVKLLDLVPMLKGTVNPAGYPLLTGLCIGFGGSWLMRMATKWMGEKYQSPDPIEQPATPDKPGQ